MRRRGYALVFVVVALAGLVVWAISTPAVAGPVLGDAAYRAAYSFPLWAYFGLPLLALPSLVAGSALPKGFLLWGVAAVLPYVPGAIWLTLRAGPEVVFQTADPGIGQILGLVWVDLAVFVVLTVVCTISAGVGAAIRLLLWGLRGESVAEKLGMPAASSPRG